ncbi:Transport protein SEC31 [Tripterygium wilfordii]|uniref:Transport protein SEC31 n=1 Tax=Tripterygium wilfordii TaxID=458696 RepID=A0A7J7CBC7_TRIWF|nr:uncharacterized protein LOC119985669 [Tripterygium wilfordii]XP_038685905.1 uncharacterized protein LOC119985669 [Tripterygium wilfordii]KAF5731167.1 Transport protein SEC31 [Tripterygium wilfordii]
MDNMVCDKVQPVVRKVKKKQKAKGELDRLKQAEKKKRRLEKALATSAAIRSELEKKRQKKIEEQQRLDEEGAAIAEAVALHVLLGEDSDDPCKIMLNREGGFNPWHCAENFDLFMGGRRAYLPHQEHVNEHGYKLRDHESGDWSLSYVPIERNRLSPNFDDEGWGTAEFSAGLLAAQAVSSLRIAEDAHVDAVVLNGILRG